MSFLFGGPKFDYKQLPGSQGYIDRLSNFNPWGSMPPGGIGLAGRGYREDIKALRGGADVTKVKGLMPILQGIGSAYGNANRMADMALTTGDAALANSGLLNAQRAQLASRAGQQQAQDIGEAIGGYQERAMQGYQGARNSQLDAALRAAGIKLDADQGALQGYLGSFRGPTSMGRGLMGFLQDNFKNASQVAGKAGFF